MDNYKNRTNDNETQNISREDPPLKYIPTVIIDIMLGIIFGIYTNHFINVITRPFNIGINGKVIIQIVVISIVIYIMKELAKHIHQEPLSNYSYDVIFISVYISSQENIQEILQKIK